MPVTAVRESGKGAQHCACQCHWDLSWLRFGDSRISPMDSDGMFVVERYRKFLFIETKTAEEPLTQGQEILLRELSFDPGFTVLLVRGPKSFPQSCTEFTKGHLSTTPTSREDFQNRVDRWFSRVCRSGKKTEP